LLREINSKTLSTDLPADYCQAEIEELNNDGLIEEFKGELIQRFLN
jgi:hypothetical protein